MKNRIAQVAAVCSAAFLFVGSPCAHADPVVVATGTYSAPGSDPAFFDFIGNGFDVSGEGTPVGVGPVMTCAECNAGTVIDLGASIKLPDSYTAGVTGPNTAVIGGTTYSNVFYTASLLFDAPAVVAPPNTGKGVTFTDPFTFSGALSGFPTAARDTAPLFTLNLTGSGTVQFGMNAMPGGAFDYSYGDTYYTFSPSPSPTPEPASVILLGAGLLGAVVRKRA